MAQVRFEAISDARQVVLGGSFEVEFTLYNASGSDFTPPSFRNFEVLSGPANRSSVSIVNGKRSESYGLAFVLQPKKIGTFTIGPASVKVNGKIYRTQSFRIDVVKGRNSKATTKEQLDKELGEGVFIKAVINKEASRIGEQVTVDYKLYTSRNIESFNVLSESEYSGFFVHDIRRFNSRQVQEVVDGVQYTTKLIKRVALFPQQAGVFTIDPLLMNVSVIVGEKKRRSIFSMPKVNTFRIQTEPVEVRVLPLPDAPPTFTGAVGKFEMRTTLNRNQLTTDDAISMRMYINGNGDIKQVQPPRLQLSDKFEVYDPKVIEESSFESRNELVGKKVFEYLILPKEPGEYTLTSAFSYYDTDSLDFVTLTSESFPIAVTKGELDRNQTIASVQSDERPEDIRFIKTDFSLSKSGPCFPGSTLFWGLIIFPFILLGGVITWRQIELGKANVDVAVLRKRKAVKVATKRLAQAKGLMDKSDSKAFYDEVSRASFGYVCDKLNIPFSELTKENVQTRLQSLGVHETSIQKFLQVVKNCEMALFAGKDNAAAMKETYDQAIDLISEMEEQLGK